MCSRFRSFPFRSVPFRSLLFRFRLLSLCLFLSSFFPSSPSQWVFFGAASPLSLPCFSPFFPTWFPVSSFPVLRTRLSVCFLSPFPDSLPQLFLRCLPCALAFGLFPFPSAFFRPLLFRFRLLSFLFRPFLFLPVSASQMLPRCCLSAFASLLFPVLSDLISHVLFPGSSYSAFCSFPFVPP